MVHINAFAKQKQSYRGRKQTGFQEGKRRRDELGDWD